jgi:hypothetical protein
MIRFQANSKSFKTAKKLPIYNLYLKTFLLNCNTQLAVQKKLLSRRTKEIRAKD